MKKLSWLLLLLLFTPTLLFAGSYLSLNVGGIFSDYSTKQGTQREQDPGVAAIAAAGLISDNLPVYLRGEVELGYRKSKLLDAWALMPNFVVDFSMPAENRLFIGGGAGVADIRKNKREDDDSQEFVVAYQGIVGWSFKITAYDFLDLQYRYVVLDESKIENGSHNIMIGWRMGL